MDSRGLKNILIVAACCLSLGTTYVVKEGGKEVGRYEENDGKSETVEVGSQAPAPRPVQKKPAAKPAAKSKADVWGVRRSNAPAAGSEAGPHKPTIEEAQAQSAQIQAEAQAKKAETERAIADMEKG